LNSKSTHDILPLGDSALIVEFGPSREGDRWCFAQGAGDALTREAIDGFIEAVPGLSSLTIHFDPRKSDFSAMRDRVDAILDSRRQYEPVSSRTVTISVCYDAEFAPDLEIVANHSRLSPEAVVQRHASADYIVQFLGFSPGFAYLTGLPHELATPRLASPRTSVPAGSVGIGQDLTGVYPMEIAGGWNLIGRTPQRMFLPERDPPTVLRPGDCVKFVRISKRKFDAWRDDE
jgi:inhibitor of KinA